MRLFVRHAVLLGICASALCLVAGEPTAGDGFAAIKVGVVSDSHVGGNPENGRAWRKALELFRAANVDVVVHAGDMTERGTLAELQQVMQTWNEVFTGGTNACGGAVMPVFCFGNHDYHDASFQRSKPMTDEEKASAIVCNKDAAWQLIAGEPFPGEVWSRRVKGFHFVVAHWKHESENAQWFASHPPEKGKPVFYVQHPHPKGTCFTPWTSSDAGRGVGALLSRPDVISFSGHSHASVADDRAFWHGAFVSLGAGALCGAVGVREFADEPRPAPLAGGRSRQATLVTVCGNRVTFESFELDDARRVSVRETTAW